MHLPAEGVAQQFATELAENGIATFFQKVVSQARHAVDFASVRESRAGVDGASGEITFTSTSDGVKALQREEPNGSILWWHEEH